MKIDLALCVGFGHKLSCYEIISYVDKCQISGLSYGWNCKGKRLIQLLTGLLSTEVRPPRKECAKYVILQ